MNKITQTATYADTIADWQRDPEAFWAEAAKGIDGRP